MGRPGLSKHRKFKRLARTLDGLQVGFGSILARGAVEQLWEGPYEAGVDYLGDSRDVEAAAGWNGPEGMLTQALAAAGGEDHAGFIEEGGSQWWSEGKPGTYRVHDLYDHAPEYVRKRMDREAARKEQGETLSSVRAKAARARWDKRRDQQASASEEQAASACMTSADGSSASGTPPAPAPAPTPDAAATRAGAREELGPEAAEPAHPTPAPAGAGPVSPTAVPLPVVRPVAEDERPRRRLEVVDESGPASSPFPWKRAAGFRQAITDRMARTVLYPVGGQEAKVWASLEESLALIPEEEAVEICRERILALIQAGKRQPGTLAYFAQVLADEAIRRRARPAPATPAPLPPAGCPQWERMRAKLQERENRDTFEKFHADLVGRMDGAVLVLAAPDPYRRNFLTDEHADLFVQFARELGEASDVRFEAAETRAAGGT